MREIKFRAWNGGEMKYSGIKVHADGHFECDNHLDCIDFEPVLMQYTGLKDKDGVEIYEGDILKRVHFQCADGVNHYIHHTIKWSEKYNGWVALNLSSMSESDGSPQLFVYAKGEHEVIGNIYENPELLESNND